VLRVLSEIGATSATRILDIGPSHLTELVREQFGVRADTLGFGSDLQDERGRHFGVDLNAAQDRAA